MAWVKSKARKLMKLIGLDSCQRDTVAIESQLPPDIDPATVQLFRAVQPYTMTGIERVAALRNAVQYIIRNKIPGNIVECGVWKGGSMMAIAKTLIECNSTDRRLFLFDTFEGMPQPGGVDKDMNGRDAAQIMEQSRGNRLTDNVWAIAPLNRVMDVMQQTLFNPSQIVYVKGKVEDTIPDQAPNQIALLRLDTDWYESTYHELVHLYPRLSIGGVLIIDDYGHWQGARRAVDQYLEENCLRLLLNRIDYTSRIAVKIE